MNIYHICIIRPLRFLETRKVQGHRKAYVLLLLDSFLTAGYLSPSELLRPSCMEKIQSIADVAKKKCT